MKTCVLHLSSEYTVYTFKIKENLSLFERLITTSSNLLIHPTQCDFVSAVERWINNSLLHVP